ncbi:MAG TPA: SRPBCC domain-containing protein [Candidatus Acidoferrum sp.]|nr:SRPBCC domain-containing protein [Candidatus Acidoferrum sp.]
MADICHEFTVKAPRKKVFEMVSTPAGLDRWWTKTSSGEPKLGAEFSLGFGPGFDWLAEVTRCTALTSFELKMLDSHEDWMKTRVTFGLEEEKAGVTRVRFQHTGWPLANKHWRVSCFCWAMYLRIMRRHLEFGEEVPYEKRLEV